MIFGMSFELVGKYGIGETLLEKKYKFSAHKIPLEDLLKQISEEFPIIQKLSFKNPGQIAKFMHNISFLLTPKYIGTIMTSRHRKEYFEFAAHIFKYLKDQSF